MFPREGIGLLY